MPLQFCQVKAKVLSKIFFWIVRVSLGRPTRSTSLCFKHHGLQKIMFLIRPPSTHVSNTSRKTFSFSEAESWGGWRFPNPLASRTAKARYGRHVSAIAFGLICFMLQTQRIYVSDTGSERTCFIHDACDIMFQTCPPIKRFSESLIKKFV